MEFLNSLNQEQRQAATIVSGYELMLAGAGTGKTHTLITRVAYLIASGISARNILLLTFTNKAAREMRDRLVEYVGAGGKEVVAMTFHSFILRMFREYGGVLGLPNYRVLDTGDDETLMRSVRKSYMERRNFSKTSMKEMPSVKKLQTAVSSSLNQQVPLDMVLLAMCAEDESMQGYKQDMEAVIDLYEKEKQGHQYLNFDDILQEFANLLEIRTDFTDMLSRRFLYVMCDEYQDTNRLQERILSRLTAQNGNLCVVGDDNQSIYKFRSADIQNILMFQDRYPDCQVIPLIQNYRSTQEILDVSNQMMLHATEGIPKQLIGQKHGKKPVLVSCRDDRQTAKYIVNKMLAFEQHGVPRSRQAVLVRKAAGSTYLEQECQKRGILIQKYGGRRFVEKKNVKMATSYLRLAVDDRDELAWRMLLQEYPGIGAATVNRMMEKATSNGVDVILHPGRYLQKVTKIASSLSDFQPFWSAFTSGQTVAEKLAALEVHYHQLLDRQMERTTSDKEQERLEKQLQELHEDMNVLRDMAETGRSVSVFLDNLLLENQKEKENDEAFIISTIHSAKGLEWDVVYLLHPVEEVFHDWDDGPEEEAEERRVMYVALTRARKRLELVQARTMMLNGKMVPSTISSFLDYPDVQSTLDRVQY